MLIIGLTGNLGSGKSTVAGMMGKLGAKIIDADAVTKSLLTENKKCIKKVAKIFPDVILENSKVNRFTLAKIVFSNPRELYKLTNILYPEALKVVKAEISRYKNEFFVVLDVPLLFESGWDKFTDITIVVKSTRAQQMARATRRLNITKQEALRRLENQMPLKDKCAKADIIIDNSRGLKLTRKQVESIFQTLRRRQGAKEKT